MTRVLPRDQATVSGRRRGRSLNSLAIQLSAFALTFILIALLVVTSSRAAFVAQNDNTGNELSSASITLTDNDGGATAMFTGVPALMPGTNVDRCIDVTYAGTADPTAVVLYANGAPTGDPGTYFNDMAPDIPGAFGDCTSFPTTGTTNVYTGTLAGFAARTTFASSWPTTWDPAAVGPETRTFRFRMSVVDNLSAANRTSTFGFVWETRTP